MCGPKGYGRLAVLVINRVSILADFGHFGMVLYPSPDMGMFLSLEASFSSGKGNHIVTLIHINFLFLFSSQYLVHKYIVNSFLLHITREFYSIKLICTNLYALFSHVRKAYTANQNCVQLFYM